MKRIEITFRTPNGEFLDEFGTNSDQLADRRINRILKHEPDAVVTRTEDHVYDTGPR